MDKPEDAKKLVEFYQSACYGNCPHYSMIIKTDGSVIYTGKRNVDRMGIYQYQLDKREYSDLVKSLKSADLYQYNDKYNEQVADGQATTIAYHGEKGLKKISSKLRFPGNLKVTADKLEGIANKDIKWTAIDVPPVDGPEDIVAEKDDKPTRKIVSYSQGACFGKCPVFSIDILTDKTALLIGKRFTEKEGIYEKQLTTKVYEEVITLLESPDFMSLENMYDQDLMDAQQFTIQYFGEGVKSKKVTTKITKPNNLEAIIQLMQTVESSRGWNQKEAKDSKDVSNTILVSIKPKVKAKKWVESKKHLGLEVVRYLSPNGTYFLVSYNTELNIDRVMDELRRDRDVLSVSSGDQPAMPRGGVRTGKSGNKGKANLGEKKGN